MSSAYINALKELYLSVPFCIAPRNVKMKYLILIAIFATVVKAELHHRKEKFIPIPYVTYPQDACRNTSNLERGVCVSKKQCNRAGGTRIGDCAMGYGTCCAFVTDGTQGAITTVTRNLTTIVSPDIRPYTSSFRFPRQMGVCQLKLTFQRFDITQPERMGNNSGSCLTDYMRITGSVTVNNLEICGRLEEGEHMYLDYGQGSQIDIVLHLNNSTAQGYRFWVTQIKCESALRVPSNCLQYHRNQTGRVMSFNYPTQQLNRQRYIVCVEQRNINSDLRWSVCPVDPPNNLNAFSITGENVAPRFKRQGPPEIPPEPLPGDFQPAPECPTDYIEFFSSGKICKAPFQDITTPGYLMYVNFDEREDIEPETGTITLTPCIPPLPPQGNPNYGAWFASTTVDMQCVARPLGRTRDSGNRGFCLMYSTVAK